MRPRMREAVSPFLFQIGVRTVRISSVPMSETRRSLIGRQYSVKVILHWARCFALRHDDAIEARNISVHTPNVGSASFALSEIGSRPARTAARQSPAFALAIDKETPG